MGVCLRKRPEVGCDMPAQGSEISRFGPFEFEPQTWRLTKNGHRIKLQPKSAAILKCLLEFPDEVVSRERLKEKLWPAGTYVAFDLGIKVAVKKLRDALCDSPDNPLYIQTIHGEGYQFIATVTRVVKAANDNREPVTSGESTVRAVKSNALGTSEGWAAARATILPPILTNARPRNFRRLLHISYAGIFPIIGLVIVIAWRLPRPSPAAPPVEKNLTSVPIVTYAGGEQWLPAFSPDGSRVAYSWSTSKGWFLEVKQLGSDVRLRLTTDAAKFPPGPAWSPDGRQIAFARADTRDYRGIFITSALGGPERKLRTLAPWRVPQRIVSWSPDGRWIAFADEALGSSDTKASPPKRGPNVLYLISPDSLETRQLTSPVGEDFGDSAPVFSPDGSTIAFVHTTADSQDEICTVVLQGGTPRKLVVPGIWTNGITWTPDGKSLIFDRSLAGGFSLWTSDLVTGESHLLKIPANRGNLLEPSMWRDRLAYEFHESKVTVGQIPLNGTIVELPAEPVASTRNERLGHFSPQGDRIAFVSDRTGTDEVWIADREGANPSQMTHLAMPLNGLAWSPSGNSLAFSSISGKVFLLSFENSSAALLFEGAPFTDETVSNIAFSRDGHSVYVITQPGTGLNYVLLKVPVGGGAPVRVMDGFLTNFAESIDGDTLYYSRAESASRRDTLALWKRPVSGGSEQFLTPASGVWDVGSNGLYLLTKNSTIDLYSFSGRRVRTVAKVGPYSASLPLSISPDGCCALFDYERHHAVEIETVQGVN
jgi:Tol biopolymer transport system component/DNA-binding winged helix-turn-helix (wHTH) protein